MPCIIIIGNSGGGKSTRARKLAERRGLPQVEIDRLLWQDGRVLTPEDVYRRQHREIIGSPRAQNRTRFDDERRSARWTR
jgi:shikimate kinase